MKYQNTENGSVIFNVVMAILLVAIGVLAYMLITERGNQKTVRTIGTENPTATERAPAKAKDISVTSDAADDEFNDGLGRASTRTTYPLDEFGAGVGSRDIFIADINNDGNPDRITRITVNSGTAHASTQYTIEIATDSGYTDITPPEFNTIEGADCALRKIRINLSPRFQAVRISRPMGDTWDTPTVPVKEVFSLSHNQIIRTGAIELPETCDVAELF